MAEGNKQQKRTIYQLTRNVGQHQAGETFTDQQVKDKGFADGDLQAITTDRSLTSEDTTKR